MILLFYHIKIFLYYKEKYNLICKTFGITRDFKSLFVFESKNLIKPLSKIYFTFFLSFFLIRFISSFLILKETKVYSNNVHTNYYFLFWIYVTCSLILKKISEKNKGLF